MNAFCAPERVTTTQAVPKLVEKSYFGDSGAQRLSFAGAAAALTGAPAYNV
jgi:hypothetical protein